MKKKRFFVTGTDTGVGKTVVSSIIANEISASYWKPFQTGDESDSQSVKDIFSSIRSVPEAYHFKAPLSPYSAALIENVEINIDYVLDRFHSITDERLVVEGAGGVFVPIKMDFFMSDLIKLLDLPVVLVARSGLGTLNHTLLTLEHLRNKDIDVICTVLNGKRNKENEKIIEKAGSVKVEYLEYFDMGSDFVPSLPFFKSFTE